MDDDLYRLIPEEGKHLAESRDTEGAYRGVYLDDETNRPSGAGEFIKVDPSEYNSNDSQLPTPSTDASDGANMEKLLTALVAFVAGAIVMKATPHVKKWAKEKASPLVKRVFKKEKTETTKITTSIQETTELAEVLSAEQELSDAFAGIDVAYNGYRENMSSEAAQRELIEAFILHLECMKRLNRVKNANIVCFDGTLTDGKAILESIDSSEMLDSVNALLKNNPALLGQGERERLSEVLGYEIVSNKEYIPITAESLITGILETE